MLISAGPAAHPLIQRRVFRTWILTRVRCQTEVSSMGRAPYFDYGCCRFESCAIRVYQPIRSLKMIGSLKTIQKTRPEGSELRSSRFMNNLSSTEWPWELSGNFAALPKDSRNRQLFHKQHCSHALQHADTVSKKSRQLLRRAVQDITMFLWNSAVTVPIK